MEENILYEIKTGLLSKIEFYSDQLYIKDIKSRPVKYSDIKAIKQCNRYIYLIEQDSNKRHYSKWSKYYKTDLYSYNTITKIPNTEENYNKILDITKCTVLENISTLEDSSVLSLTYNKYTFFSNLLKSFIFFGIIFMCVGAILEKFNSALLNLFENYIGVILTIGTIISFFILKYHNDKNIHCNFSKNSITYFSENNPSNENKIYYSYILKVAYGKSHRFDMPNYILIYYLLPDSAKIQKIKMKNINKDTIDTIKDILNTAKTRIIVPEKFMEV